MRFSLLTTAFVATAAAQDLISALQSQPDLSTLFETLSTLPELAAALNSSSNITILAPINSAFEKLLNAPLNAENQALSSGDPNGTTNLLSYHVIQGAVPSSAIATTPTYVQTLFTSDIPILGNARTNVTGGQNVGVVNNGTNVLALSGDLQFSTVVEAVSTLDPLHRAH
jgi:transforming growth factor-beta-induced protein